MGLRGRWRISPLSRTWLVGLFIRIAILLLTRGPRQHGPALGQDAGVRWHSHLGQARNVQTQAGGHKGAPPSEMSACRGVIQFASR